MEKITTSLFVTLMCFSIVVHVTQGQEQNLGRFIGTLNQRQAIIVQGDVYSASRNTIVIDRFTFNPFEGTADAFFFIGNTIGSGLIIATEGGSTMPLRSYNNERVLLRIDDQIITNFQVLYIWIPSTEVNLGDVSIPPGLVLPAEVSLGQLGLNPVLHNVHADNVIILNAKQLRLVNFSYDDSAPDVYFWVGTGTPSGSGQRVPDENGVINEPISEYNRETITITLPDNLTVFDVNYLSVWCQRFAVDFGHVVIPMNLDPLLLPAFLDAEQPEPKVFGNCQVLEEDKFQVAWTVNSQRNVICIQLRGKVDLNEYMAFGISGSPTSTLMRGSDVTVGWTDASTMQGNAVDYFLENYVPCSVNQAIGACPDVLLGGTDDVTLINHEVRDGVTYITYEKPLTAAVGLMQSDLSIPLDRPVFISWAYGRINDIGLVTRHETRTPGNVQINFGMASSTCPDFTPETDNEPVVPWFIPPIVSLTSNTFTAFIGPSGGLRGVQGITGVVGWGIAWYINNAIIPEITVSRGVQYVFVVNGGNDPTTPALNHPFYITSSERGGYSQLTEAQQQLETIYAGPVSGPLCEWKTTADPIDHPSFNTYQATLNLECVVSTGGSGVFRWIPDNNTPDLVYYQCYTHQYLGWKINVVGEAPIQPCDSQPCQNGGICTNFGTTAFLCNCAGTGFTGTQCQTGEPSFQPCDFQPCVNQGVCTNTGPTSFQCNCPTGFTGERCEIPQILPCDTQPCQNGGTCTNVGTTFQCGCPTGFSGSTCSIPQILPCDMQPCQNDGICSNVGTTFQCQCPAGFSGTTCSAVVIVPCELQPCENGATCVNIGSTFQCLCRSGFTGVTCQNAPPLPCDVRPCRNGGTCVNIVASVFRCICPDSFTGQRCQNSPTPSPCDSITCLNGGTCTTVGNGATCQCTPQFTGTFCERMNTVTLPCDLEPCRNGGVCENAGSSFVCNCQPGFSGPACEAVVVVPCELQPCENGATCMNIGSTFQCLCRSGFTGVTCQNAPPLPCDMRPCQNGGTCVNIVASVFRCICPDSFTGQRCQNSPTPSPCDSVTCLNGGTCTTMGNGATCQCTPQFIGTFCERMNTVCNFNPCRNGATCVQDEMGMPFCICAEGFHGNNCQFLVDGPCNTSPCFNGGICNNIQLNAFQCDCRLTSFTGRQCNIPLSLPCNSNPCLNGGTCRNTVSNTGFTCFCEPPFTGPTCQRVMLPCESAPCMNGGVCVGANNAEGFICSCPASFIGPRCEESVCNPNPCRNGATCFAFVNVPFFCLCADGFTGETCEFLVGPCGSRPCLNGGTCLNNPTAPSGFTCDCTNTGFVGTNCQTANLCLANPCANGGRCQQTQNRITCDCSGTGFTGPICTLPEVRDTTPPTISNCPSQPIRRTAPTGTSQVAVSWTAPRATDASGIASTDVNFPPGSLFIISTTPVRYVFTDGAGNSAVCTFDVIVTGTDATPPTISNCPPQPIRRTAPIGTSQVAVSWTTPRATDASGIESTDVNFLPGSLFIIGTTPVRYVFTDGAGNSAVCTFDVIVTGTDPPTGSFTVTCPGDICMVPPAGMLFVQVIWNDPVVSGGVGRVSQLRGPAVNSAFYQAGTGEVVIYQFSDGANNFAECDFRITVMADCQQSTSPLMVQNCPGDMSHLLNQGSISVFVEWDDLVVTGDGNVRQIAGPPSSSGTFSLGDTLVEYIFQDDSGQRATCTFTVRVTQVDPGSIFIACPSDIVVTVLRGVGGSIVSYDLPAVRDNSFVPVNSPRPPGSFFRVGTSPISYAYLGPAGEFEQCAFTITVNEASPCDIPSCQNGGTCIPLTLTDFTCACPGCFRGDQCEDVVNACDGNQCQNGGTCQPFIGSCEQYFCLCPPCLSGIFCELQTNPCDSGSCGNGAICSPIGTGCSQFTCQCQGCFLGPLCEQEFNPCSNNPCQNGGICQPLQGSCSLYTCDCQGCFTGFNCEIPFNPCQNQPCLNGGTCRNDPTSCTGYSCDCIQCFAGFQCELAIANLCDGNPCVNGGTCVRTGESCTSFLCLCEEGFGGPLCQTVPQVVTNPCSSAPCQNGGSCLLTENGYHCICRVGYRGNNCESSIDEIFSRTSCFNGLCQNGGTCYDSYTSTQPLGTSFQYTCLCPPGFTGQACSLQSVQAVRFDACGIQGPNFCSNNGVCLNAFISISRSIIPVCDCPVGFAGHFCGVNVGNPCIPNPCRNNGQCTDFGRYFICECVQPYAGETCESLQVDRTPPDIMNCPTQTIVVRTTQTHAIVNWPEPTATDNSQFPVRLVSANAAPGALYPVGTSRRVFYNFEDLAGNTATCSFIIQVLSEN